MAQSLSTLLFPAAEFGPPSNSAPGQAASQGVSQLLARADHVHGREEALQPATTVTLGTSYGSAQAVGTSVGYARADHSHGTPSLSSAAASTVGYGSTSTVGTGTTAARSDHTHGLARPTVTDINATGTPSATTYLRGDGSWAAVAAGSQSFYDLVRTNGAASTQRAALNFVPGTGITLGAVDDAAANETELTITAAVTPAMIPPGSFQNGQYNFTTLNATTDIEYGDRSISRGLVTGATKTTNTVGANSTTVFTNVITTPAFQVVAGRRYRVIAQAFQVNNGKAANQFFFDYAVTTGTASLVWEPNRDFQSFAATGTMPFGNHVGFFLSNSTATIALTWRFISSGTAGALTIVGTTTDPTAIHVEDVGI